MRLFERAIQTIKDIDLISSNADRVIKDIKGLEVNINEIKKLTNTLSKTRRKNQSQDREIISNQILQVLELVGERYLDYLSQLNFFDYLLKRKSEVTIPKKIQQNIDLVFNSKAKIRKEFENIYRHFKSLAKNFDDIPMKAILSKMREEFGFENNQDQSSPNNKIYYDSTTMTFRLLN